MANPEGSLDETSFIAKHESETSIFTQHGLNAPLPLTALSTFKSDGKELFALNGHSSYVNAVVIPFHENSDGFSFFLPAPLRHICIKLKVKRYHHPQKKGEKSGRRHFLHLEEIDRNTMKK
ncbi:hypothetical protein H6G69_07525 [Nostoc sp. FACHB-110]|nr:hypothetical protein [Nostoc sp. FACHB-110]